METVIGMSGASGACYGIRLLEVLGEVGCTTHLVMSEAARKIIEIETDKNVREIETMADHVYLPRDFTAPIASGSHPFDAMVVVPCSMRTLAGIANGVADTLITRVADVGLKERRRLILVPRESPLSLIHLRNMVVVTEAGAVVLPACPGFYSQPRSLEDLVDVVVGRILDLLGLDHSLYRRWRGVPGRNAYNDRNQISD